LINYNMANGKGLSLKDWITIASFVIMLLGFGAKAVLLSDQVGRNDVEIIKLNKELDEANLKVLNYRLGEIESKVGKIYDYIMEQE